MACEIQKERNTLISFMSRHFVALACEYDSLNNDGTVFRSGTALFSGFVLELREEWFWVTAGHCLKELDTRIRKGQLRINGGGFVDSFGHEAMHTYMVPFTYDVECGFYVDDESLGLDFGLIRLDGNKRKLLRANKVIPVCRFNWLQQATLTFDMFKMLGIPEDRVVSEGAMNEGRPTLVGPVMFNVEPIDPDGIENPPRAVWFIGRIHPEAEISTLKGMSGGPIYGFRRDSEGRWSYHVVALQSSWRPHTRTVFGCSLPLFAEAVYQCLTGSSDDTGIH